MLTSHWVEHSVARARDQSGSECYSIDWYCLKGMFMEKTIEIRLQDENARHIERFLQGFLATHKFQPPYAGSEIKAFDELYAEIRKGLDHVSVPAKK
jgi:hypothetical protein